MSTLALLLSDLGVTRVAWYHTVNISPLPAKSRGKS